jgi:hypothetical protein
MRGFFEWAASSPRRFVLALVTLVILVALFPLAVIRGC